MLARQRTAAGQRRSWARAFGALGCAIGTCRARFQRRAHGPVDRRPLVEPAEQLSRDDDVLDLGCAFVDLGDLGVAVITLGRKLFGEPIAAEDLNALGGVL